MRNYTDDILKGTAMEEVQIIKTTSKSTPVIASPPKVEKTKPKKVISKTVTSTKIGRVKKAGKVKFIPYPNSVNRRGPDFASLRVPKEFTDALNVLFDNKKITQVMDEVICDYLNRHRNELEEKYRKLNPFD